MLNISASLFQQIHRCSFDIIAANCYRENETYEIPGVYDSSQHCQLCRVSLHQIRNISAGFQASLHHRDRNSQRTWQSSELHFHRAGVDCFSQSLSNTWLKSKSCRWKRFDTRTASISTSFIMWLRIPKLTCGFDLFIASHKIYFQPETCLCSASRHYYLEIQVWSLDIWCFFFCSWMFYFKWRRLTIQHVEVGKMEMAV